MRSTKRALTLLCTVTLIVGCAARGAPRPDTTDGASSGRVVTAQDLERIAYQGSLMDALERLRPVWLQSRGETPAVSVDGGPSTDVSVLRTIPASTVLEVRLERSTTSVGRATIAPNGDIRVGGALIVVTTRRGTPPNGRS